MGTTALCSAPAARGGSWATRFLSQGICREKCRFRQWGCGRGSGSFVARWKVNLFFCRTSLHRAGNGRHRLSIKPALKTPFLTGFRNQTYPWRLLQPAGGAAPWESHCGGTGVTGGAAVATSPGAVAQKWFGTRINTVGAAKSGALPFPCLKEPPALLLTPIKPLPYGRGAQPCTVCHWLNWSVGFDLI